MARQICSSGKSLEPETVWPGDIFIRRRARAREPQTRARANLGRDQGFLHLILSCLIIGANSQISRPAELNRNPEID